MFTVAPTFSGTLSKTFFAFSLLIMLVAACLYTPTEERYLILQPVDCHYSCSLKTVTPQKTDCKAVTIQVK